MQILTLMDRVDLCRWNWWTHTFDLMANEKVRTAIGSPSHFTKNKLFAQLVVPDTFEECCRMFAMWGMCMKQHIRFNQKQSLRQVIVLLHFAPVVTFALFLVLCWRCNLDRSRRSLS